MASPVLPVDIADLKVLVPSVSDAAAQIFIDTADAIVQSVGIPTAYTARVAYLIELYLAAHFTTLSAAQGALIASKVGNSQDQYSNPADMMLGIANTRFGLNALALDTKGLLSELATKPLKAQFQVYGRDSDASLGRYAWPWGTE